MDRVDSDKMKNLDVAVWKEYKRILDAVQDQKTEITYLERYQFYERAKKAYGTKNFCFTKMLFFRSRFVNCSKNVSCLQPSSN